VTNAVTDAEEWEEWVVTDSAETVSAVVAAMAATARLDGLCGLRVGPTPHGVSVLCADDADDAAEFDDVDTFRLGCSHMVRVPTAFVSSVDRVTEAEDAEAEDEEVDDADACVLRGKCIITDCPCRRKIVGPFSDGRASPLYGGTSSI
jgi:hypothetical protein